MYSRLLFLLTLTTLPGLAQAQTAQVFLGNLLDFINGVVIPFIFGIAFLFFAINVIRYFVFEGANEDGREKAKRQATYGVLAFVVITVFWGLVNLLSSSIGFNNANAPTTDYAGPGRPGG